MLAMRALNEAYVVSAWQMLFLNDVCSTLHVVPLSLPVRAIVTAEKVLLFEPQQPASRKFLEVVLQHFQARQQPGQPGQMPAAAVDLAKSTIGEQQSHEQYMSRCAEGAVGQKCSLNGMGGWNAAARVLADR